MQKIVPHLWFDREAREAAEFYVSVFGDGSALGNVTTLRDTPSGDSDVVSFALWQHEFMAISAGPLFEFNPSVSFIVGCETADEIDRLWEGLAEGGSVLMPLDRYPFSERYGWLQDRYGLSWQLILTSPEGDERPRIVPALLFGGDRCGDAEEAIDFYLAVFESVFESSRRGALLRYGADGSPNVEGTVMFADFRLLGTWFAAMDSAQAHAFDFNEAVSFVVRCESQDEIDACWAKLSAVPEAEQCGWLKDRYGVSWQIVPTALDEMLKEGTPDQIDRVTQAFLPMKKFDVASLEAAYRGG